MFYSKSMDIGATVIIQMKKIAILGEFDPARETQIATNKSLEHSARLLGITVKSEWISSTDISDNLFHRCNAILIAPGSEYKSQKNILWAIHVARKHQIPCLGTCGGFQHIILEYARNELGFADAQSEEYSPESEHLFIARLSCSLRGREMQLSFVSGSMVEKLYGMSQAIERYYCSLGVNPAFLDSLRSGPLKIVGKDSEGEVRVVELPNHPFFLGTLYVPQAQSRADKPHPLVTGFLQAL